MRTSRVLALAWRESRFARRRLLLFLSAISLGVAALVAVQGFANNLERGVERESKSLLGADAELESRQPFAGETLALLDSLEGAGVPVARVTSLASMALLPRTGGTRLAQVRAAEPGYPFYGVIETEPAEAWQGLHQGRNAVADPALIAALQARIGDSISVGEARFQLVGAIRKVPGDVDIASSFAPRLYIPAAQLRGTRLIEFGSRVDYAAYILLPAPAVVQRLLDDYRDIFRAERVRSETAAEQQRDVSRALGRLSSYLGLIGVFALMLGGIGVASAMGAYMAEKVDTVAVLRCLGATARQVLAIYLVQAAVMGLAGATIGAALGAGVQWVLPWLARGLLPVEATVTLDGLSVAMGIGIGVWTAVVFALLPLLRVRRVSPLGALRRRVDPVRLGRGDPARWLAGAALAGSVLLLLAYQVDDVQVGASLAAGIAGTLAVLWAVAWAITQGVRRLPRTRLPYTARQGLANLYRPGNQTRTVTVALGFGVFLLATLLLVQHSLLLPLRTDGVGERANLLFWDVQDDQVDGLDSLLAGRGLRAEQSAPIVPMRIAAIRGEEVRAWGGAREDSLDVPEEDEGAPEGEGEGEGRPERWAVRREYRSTYRDSLGTSERMLSGEWWEAGVEPADGIYPVSLEVEIAGDLRVEIGDRIDWDVQGVRIPTRVASLREVDWARFEPNFFAVFPREALRGAPQIWVVLARAATAEERGAVQRDAVVRFPNIAVVDLTQIQEALDQVLGQVSAVIRFLAGFSIATGFIVLLGAVSTSRLQRIRESVLLKTLGATRRQIGSILFTEYLLLGVLAAVTGIVLAVGASWALARWFFEVDFEPVALPLLALGTAVAAVAVAVGLWASREVFEHTPLEAIREE
ncbi:MAG TPA: FtsX-like permease family protein [Longimicrobiaceae bacterium]